MAKQKYFRKTIRSEVKLEGIGVHSGKKSTLTMEPLSYGEGIIFRRKKKALDTITLSPFHISNTLNAVTLSNNLWSVQTVEHILAALHCLGITDLAIELEQEEVPIMDGSSLSFYEAIERVGIEQGKEELSPITLDTAIWAVEGDKYIIAFPQDYLSIQYGIDYGHPLLQRASFSIDIRDTHLIASEILPARTFGFLKDVKSMQEKGLIKGASLENSVVLTEDKYMNESLRFSNECIRHKVLDLLGDLYLLGRPLHAHIIAWKAGHGLDVDFVKKIAHSCHWEKLKSVS